MLPPVRILPALLAVLIAVLATSYAGADALGSCTGDDCPRAVAASAEATHIAGAHHAPGGHAPGAGGVCVLTAVLAAAPISLAFQSRAGAAKPGDQSPPGELRLAPGTPPPRPA